MALIPPSPYSGLIGGLSTMPIRSGMCKKCGKNLARHDSFLCLSCTEAHERAVQKLHKGRNDIGITVGKNEEEKQLKIIDRVKKFTNENKLLTQVTAVISIIGVFAYAIDNYPEIKGKIVDNYNKLKSNEGVRDVITDLKGITEPFKHKFNKALGGVKNEI